MGAAEQAAVGKARLTAARVMPVFKAFGLKSQGNASQLRRASQNRIATKRHPAQTAMAANAVEKL
jgi:hypothetical protein